MKLSQSVGYSTIQLKIQDATGHNVMANRDVLRRTYSSLKALVGHFYESSVSADGARPPFAISFIESQNGSVVFTIEPPDLRRARHILPTLGLLSRFPARPAKAASPVAAGTALRDAVLLAHAASFVIESKSPRSVPTSTPGLSDLLSSLGPQRLRLPNAVAEALGDAYIQQVLRELFVAVREEGVASIVIGLEPNAPERRVEFVVPAADDVIRFVEGGPLTSA